MRTQRLVTVITCAAVVSPVAGQTGFEVQYGRWWHEGPATTFAAGLYGPLPGPFSWSFGATHLDDRRATVDHTQTGAAVALALFRDGRGLYGVGSAGLAMRHVGGNLDAVWSAGAGYGISLFGGPTVALEARYRWQDERLAGFWQLDPGDRRGWSVEGRLSFGLPRSDRAGTRTDPSRAPSDSEVDRLVRDSGARGSAAEVSRSVVRTAIDAMGTPYQWGGTSDNGFDCSGLIQYAYGEHGIILPRVSRDQMRQGIAVRTAIEDLRPGDLLGFSVEGRGVSHIGLYVGDGQFIHSSSRGVVLASLMGSDPNSLYWQRRWVAVRRIVE